MSAVERCPDCGGSGFGYRGLYSNGDGDYYDSWYWEYCYYEEERNVTWVDDEGQVWFDEDMFLQFGAFHDVDDDTDDEVGDIPF